MELPNTAPSRPAPRFALNCGVVLLVLCLALGVPTSISHFRQSRAAADRDRRAAADRDHRAPLVADGTFVACGLAPGGRFLIAQSMGGGHAFFSTTGHGGRIDLGPVRSVGAGAWLDDHTYLSLDRGFYTIVDLDARRVRSSADLPPGEQVALATAAAALPPRATSPGSPPWWSPDGRALLTYHGIEVDGQLVSPVPDGDFLQFCADGWRADSAGAYYVAGRVGGGWLARTEPGPIRLLLVQPGRRPPAVAATPVRGTATRPAPPMPSARPTPPPAAAIPLAPITRLASPPDAPNAPLLALWWDGDRPIRLMGPPFPMAGTTRVGSPLRLIGPDGGLVAEIPLDPATGVVETTAITPDRARLALGIRGADGVSTVEVWRLPREPGGAPSRVGAPAAISSYALTGPPRLAWAPAGDYLAAAGGGVVVLLDAEVRLVPSADYRPPPRQGRNPSPLAVAWSPNGDRLLVADSHGGVALVPRTAIGLAACGPDERGPVIQFADAQPEVLEALRRSGPGIEVVWAPDGSAFAAREPGGVRLWRADGTPLGTYAVGPGRQAVRLSWGGRGATCAISSGAEGTIIATRLNATDGGPDVVRVPDRELLALAWSTDGVLAGADSRGEAWTWRP